MGLFIYQKDDVNMIWNMISQPGSGSRFSLCIPISCTGFISFHGEYEHLSSEKLGSGRALPAVPPMSSGFFLQWWRAAAMLPRRRHGTEKYGTVLPGNSNGKQWKSHHLEMMSMKTPWCHGGFFKYRVWLPVDQFSTNSWLKDHPS